MRYKALVALSTVTVGGVAGARMYQSRLKQNVAITPDELHAKQATNIAKIQGSSLQQLQAEKLTLYRYQTCPFCGKVKAFLDYYKIPYEIVEVEPMFKDQLKGREYGKVPQLQFGDGTIIVDSNAIIEKLSPVVKAASPQEVTTWTQWVDKRLARFIVLNTNTTMREAMKSAAYVDSYEQFPFFNRLLMKSVGSTVMYLVAHLKTKKTLTNDGIGMTNKDNWKVSFYAEADRWAAEIQEHGKFHGGKQPDLADIEAYGALTCVQKFPLYEEVKANTNLTQWMEEMEQLCQRA